MQRRLSEPSHWIDGDRAVTEIRCHVRHRGRLAAMTAQAFASAGQKRTRRLDSGPRHTSGAFAVVRRGLAGQVKR